MVRETDVPLDDAVKSYLFNSQIVQTPDRERFVLIAPKDTQAIETTNNFCKELVKGNGPIEHVEFVDVRESMRNGGGPACLRLRVVLTSAELEAAHSGVILDNDKLDQLEQAITEHYRDRVEISDFADIAFANECRAARESILDIVSLGSLA
ncbi:MAG: N-succinylarginine dihydrolase [Hyphomonas sp. TMED17]|nr:MAG: N-succinylarginine dihydrolase [Hyphomonas sp. TMED17]